MKNRPAPKEIDHTRPYDAILVEYGTHYFGFGVFAAAGVL
jgi:hypothetical protein